MCMRMFVTPEWNVENRQISDKSLIFFVEYSWKDVVLSRFKGSDKTEEILVKDISLHDYYLVVSGHDFNVISASSRRNMKEYDGNILPLSNYIEKKTNKHMRRIESIQ